MSPHPAPPGLAVASLPSSSSMSPGSSACFHQHIWLQLPAEGRAPHTRAAVTRGRVFDSTKPPSPPQVSGDGGGLTQHTASARGSSSHVLFPLPFSGAGVGDMLMPGGNLGCCCLL